MKLRITTTITINNDTDGDDDILRNEELLSEFTVDDYDELCVRADYFGMESLTEDEQYIVEHFRQ